RRSRRASAVARRTGAPWEPAPGRGKPRARRRASPLRAATMRALKALRPRAVAPALVAASALSASAGLACRAPPPALAAAPDAAAPPSESEGTGLGRIEFPNSGPRAAQAPFLRGVLLLHSFEYADAAEAFREAQARAPQFALAYWGEALTYCHP